MFSPSCGKANRVWRIIFQNTCLVLWLNFLKYNILFCRIHSPTSKILPLSKCSAYCIMYLASIFILNIGVRSI